MARLGDIATVITKGTTPTSIGFNFQSDGVNFVKIESIDEKGTFITNKFDHISDECNEKLKRSQLQENDILFSIAGVHMKDGIAQPYDPYIFGQGQLDLVSIHKYAVENGMEMIVEHSSKSEDIYGENKACLDYLKLLEANLCK